MNQQDSKSPRNRMDRLGASSSVTASHDGVNSQTSNEIARKPEPSREKTSIDLKPYMVRDPEYNTLHQTISLRAIFRHYGNTQLLKLTPANTTELDRLLTEIIEESQTGGYEFLEVRSSANPPTTNVLIGETARAKYEMELTALLGPGWRRTLRALRLAEVFHSELTGDIGTEMAMSGLSLTTEQSNTLTAAYVEAAITRDSNDSNIRTSVLMAAASMLSAAQRLQLQNNMDVSQRILDLRKRAIALALKEVGSADTFTLKPN